MIKVCIADDQELLRQSLAIVLGMDDDIQIVGTCSNGLEVLRLLNYQNIDVLLLDIRMPEMDGVTCTKCVKEQFPDTKVIILTTFDDDEFIFSALKNGACGYLLKGASPQELVQAVKTVNLGGALINPDVAAKVVQRFSDLDETEMYIHVDKQDEQDISRTEWKVISLVGQGLSNKEIASNLYLSEGTVRNYLSSILSKLHLRDRTQLAIWAVQSGSVRKGLL